MGKPQVKIAQLDESRLKQVRDLEKELGLWVVALEPAVRLADLSGEQLQRLQAKEKELDVVLLAYETD
jgi:hypothetical protein